MLSCAGHICRRLHSTILGHTHIHIRTFDNSRGPIHTHTGGHTYAGHVCRRLQTADKLQSARSAQTAQTAFAWPFDSSARLPPITADSKLSNADAARRSLTNRATPRPLTTAYHCRRAISSPSMPLGDFPTFWGHTANTWSLTKSKQTCADVCKFILMPVKRSDQSTACQTPYKQVQTSVRHLRGSAGNLLAAARRSNGGRGRASEYSSSLWYYSLSLLFISFSDGSPEILIVGLSPVRGM
jgi:hypothetical protein